jgi:hypothetical protein
MDNLFQFFKNGWTSGLPESICGHGSTMRYTTQLRLALPIIIQGLKVKTIHDIGCGDLNWIQSVNLGETIYRGFDLIPRYRNITKLDIIKEDPPPADLIICRDVLMHFPNKEALIALKRIKKTCRYLLATTFFVSNVNRHEWTKTIRDCFSKLNIMISPFNLGCPILFIPEPLSDSAIGLWEIADEN